MEVKFDKIIILGYGTSDFSGDGNDSSFDYYFFGGACYNKYFGEYEGFAYSSQYIAWTPLHLAAANDNVDVFLALLDMGAKLDVKDHLENTPLKVAKKLECEKVIFALEHRNQFPMIKATSKKNDLFFNFI